MLLRWPREKRCRTLRCRELAWVCQLNGSVALSVVARCADVSRSVMIDVTELVGTVFSGLSALVIEDVGDAGEVICVRAGTRNGSVACPGCGTETPMCMAITSGRWLMCLSMAAGFR